MGKRYRAEEIVMKLRETELSINKGMDVVKALPNRTFRVSLSLFTGVVVMIKKRVLELVYPS